MALRDIKELTKATLSLYNASVVGLMYFSGCPAPTTLGTISVFSGAFLMACSSQAVNQIIEAPFDKLMKRTQNRPIPSGKLSKFQGACISGSLGAASLGIFSQFGLQTCLTAAGIWGSYVAIYIPLKRLTRFNTHIGAAIGAAPVYLGWVAGSGSFLGLNPLLMAIFLASWQFPHFYGILWTYKQDFSKAGFKMITDVDPNGKLTHRSAVVGSLGQLLAAGGLAYTGCIHPFAFTVGALSCYPSVAESLKQFQAFPNSLTGSKMMISSYKTIGTLFICMVTTWVFQDIRERLNKQIEKSAKEVRKYEHLV